MEQIKELEEVLELLNTKQYTKLRQYLAELNDADIAGLLEELEEEEMLKVFRILPKDLAADVFSYLDMDNQQKIITSLSDKEATNIINNLMADDAADLLEEMPANIVKKLLTNASPDVRRDINHLLRYPEDSAGSIMTVEYVDLKENLTVNQAIERIRKVGLDSETINICYVLDAQILLTKTRDLLAAFLKPFHCLLVKCRPVSAFCRRMQYHHIRISCIGCIDDKVKPIPFPMKQVIGFIITQSGSHGNLLIIFNLLFLIHFSSHPL
jgi:magnesium transporter